MKISGQYGINFGANFISKVNIKKLEEEKHKYNDVPASFVEMNSTDKNDYNSVFDATYYWQHDLYGMNIAYNMTLIAANKEKYPHDRVYAITTQNDNFSKIEPDNIKALAHVFEEGNKVKVLYLQVDPSLIYTIGEPDYNHVGQGMIDCLKNKYSDRCIELTSSSSAIRFYEKQGFEHYNNERKHMVWNKEAASDEDFKSEEI